MLGDRGLYVFNQSINQLKTLFNFRILNRYRKVMTKKGSAFKMFKVRKSSRAVVVTPFKHSRNGGNSKVHPRTQSAMCILFNDVFSCRDEM